jgi:copper(I)-binding protein
MTTEPNPIQGVHMRIPTSVRSVTGGSVRRRGLAVLLATLLCGTLAGCYASQNAETTNETPGTPGVDGAVGMIVLDDVYLETADTVPAGGSVALRGAFTDESSRPDRLVSVTTPIAASVDLLPADGSPASGGIAVPAGGQLDATTGTVVLRLTGLTRELSPEGIVPVTFDFATAGRVTLHDVPAAARVGGQP